MKHFIRLMFLMGTLFTLAACNSSSNKDNEETDDNTEITTPAEFAKGADLGWVTEMEANGMKFYNANGVETDCFELMQELGMNAIRLRVWVNPKGGWNGKDDVVAKAKRAAALGMDVMIDFHYSDSWADPGQQFKPAEWKDLSLADLKQAIANHTTEVLNALKSAGVTPRWVQVGNEIRPGMLWDEDATISGAFYNIRECDVKDAQTESTAVKYPVNQQNLVDFFNTGYDAVKNVCPKAIVIVHIDNAWDDQTWWFDDFFKLGGKADMIGLSHYPQTNDNKTWNEMNRLALQHIAQWSESYDKDIMVVEVGVKRSQAVSAQVLQEFMNGAKQIKRCKGVFYWEPESYGWNNYDMGAFNDNGQPTAIMDAFK